jgi:hypothetical protein
MSIIFTPRPAIPSKNPFINMKGVPSGYFLVCTSDSCFCRSVFKKIVKCYRDISSKEEDVCLVDTMLFVSPDIADLVKRNPEIAPLRY